MKQLVIDVAKCTGCNQCSLTCGFKKTQSFDPCQSRIHLIQWEDICLSVPTVCQLCADPECIRACPSQALSHHPETGAILLDKDACTVCEMCILECPYQVMQLGPDNLPTTCDLCDGDPACVKVCYPGALQFADLPEHEREPFRQMAEVFVQRRAGKSVRPPSDLLRISIVAR
jgi:anaerobic carbon-monoxide dehydrogenase iron sulfur subunit